MFTRNTGLNTWLDKVQFLESMSWNPMRGMFNSCFVSWFYFGQVAIDQTNWIVHNNIQEDEINQSLV